ncbi:MAG: transposase [Dissulfurispiraceae bacterium]
MSYCRDSLKYHVVVVTNHRKPLVTAEMFGFIKNIASRIFQWGRKLRELDREQDDVNPLTSSPANLELSALVINLKT